MRERKRVKGEWRIAESEISDGGWAAAVLRTCERGREAAEMRETEEACDNLRCLLGVKKKIIGESGCTCTQLVHRASAYVVCTGSERLRLLAIDLIVRAGISCLLPRRNGGEVQREKA